MLADLLKIVRGVSVDIHTLSPSRKDPPGALLKVERNLLCFCSLHFSLCIIMASTCLQPRAEARCKELRVTAAGGNILPNNVWNHAAEYS